MEHHGNVLRAKMKAQGLNIQQVADLLGQHRVTVEHDLKKDKITQKVIRKYAKVIDLRIDEFYPTVGDGINQTGSTGNETVVIDLLRKLVVEKDERIKLLENQIRFFPNAARVA